MARAVRGIDLIITNGDSAGELLRRSIPSTEVLPWRDVLYEGPVPATETLSELDGIRAEYLAAIGWGEKAALHEAFEARERGLSSHEQFDRVVLWFEHDLYDQLQLIQVLDWFADHPRSDDALHLVQADDFLGHQTAETLPALAARETRVTNVQIDLAQEAWRAYREETPERWAALLDRDTYALPWLGPTVLRSLEELPDVHGGLSRTEMTILKLIASGVNRPPQLFLESQRQEEAAFMGDWSFWRVLDGLAIGDEPLLLDLNGAPFAPFADEARQKQYFTSALSLSDRGLRTLEGAEMNEQISERWIGGTRIDSENNWRWDAERRVIVPPGA
ncbi:MAG: DUF1835 domain-containing protein [Pseudomonadota bacterium]|nr:DUF1835 domain-containing protein [Pseudomonadota bacterium]